MLELKSVHLQKGEIETLVIPVCEDKEIHDNQTINSLIRKAKKTEEFKGEKDEEITFYNPAQTSVKRVIFKGLGKLEKVDTESLRKVAGSTVKNCIKKDFSEVLIAVPAPKKIRQEMSDILEAMMEGAFLGNHLFDKYKEEKKHKPLEQISLFVTSETAKKFSRLISQVTAVCEGTILAREWVTTPSNEKSPVELAKSIVTIAEKEKLRATVLDVKALRKHKLNAILAVASGSENAPRMVVLEYKPKGAKKTIALVGKGITFDSGGINLKPGSASKDMKTDMAGAAAVAAAMITIAKLGAAKVNVVGLLPLVENMPSGSAYRPGDIIRTYSGKTVEIGNTDAEGRMILADAMSYTVEKYKPHTLIDLATLTGACVVGLGDKIAGVFSKDDKLAQAIVRSGEKTYERCWHLPLPDDYKESLKSEIADTNNIADMNGGGAITAALFLSDFVKDTCWAHVDIAGPAFAKKESAYCGAGGTGFGVRLLCDLLEKL